MSAKLECLWCGDLLNDREPSDGQYHAICREALLALVRHWDRYLRGETTLPKAKGTGDEK